ncbi:MAG: LysR family transcriptional regulator [Lachnospiraceae bacterium]|nr:LysR family transcriptional regulator [Lachnospiraceae bacterium]
MDLTQLKYFSTVVEEGTISAAARKLHISQPPLSMQIKNLEKEYQVVLFVRGARQIRLTEAGKLLYDYAQKILELTDSASDDLSLLAAGKQGSIRMGIVSSGDCTELFNGIRRYREHYPDVTFRIYDGNTYSLLDALEKHKIELALIRSPYLAHDLDVVEIRKDTVVAAGIDTYLDRYPEKKELKLSDLGSLPLIIYRRWEQIIRDEFDRQKITPNIYCVNDDARTSLQWAAAGLGVAMIPTSILHLVPNIRYRTLDEKALESTVNLVKRIDVDISSNAEEFFHTFQNIY